jgi:hypothetical protein
LHVSVASNASFAAVDLAGLVTIIVDHLQRRILTGPVNDKDEDVSTTSSSVAFPKNPMFGKKKGSVEGAECMLILLVSFPDIGGDVVSESE